MSAANVQKTCESTREKLKPAIDRIENFLNENALPELDQNQTEESTAFYKGFLSDLRHLLVFSEVSYEKLGVVLRRANFDVDFAEKALYNTYHQCVNSFFYPKMNVIPKTEDTLTQDKMPFVSVTSQSVQYGMSFLRFPKRTKNCAMIWHIMKVIT